MSFQSQTTDIVESNSLVTPAESIMVIGTDQASTAQSLVPASTKPNAELTEVEAMKQKFNDMKSKYEECLKVCDHICRILLESFI